ncbi:DDE superfamily endonuclease-domain-containing protein [Xylaria intraflava]|nr:DDE superfamily endonuclease-domain-containing protein [Xylaria intraflava]
MSSPIHRVKLESSPALVKLEDSPAMSLATPRRVDSLKMESSPYNETSLLSSPEHQSFRKFPLSRIINLDETPMPFEFLNGYTYDHKGARSVEGKSDRSGWDKRQATLILLILADGSYKAELRPVIIFHGEGNAKSKEEDRYHSQVIVKFNTKAYNNADLLADWIDNNLGAYTKQRDSLLVMDVAAFHKTEAIKEAIKRNKITTALIPPGLTAFIQPLDVGFNGPFKKWLDEEIETYQDNLEKQNRMPTKWSISDRRVMITHVVGNAWMRAFQPENKAMVASLFIKTGISIHPDGRDDTSISIKGIDPSKLDLNGWYCPPEERENLIEQAKLVPETPARLREYIEENEDFELPAPTTYEATKKVLAEMCKDRGLKVTGTKSVLITRLKDDDATQAAKIRIQRRTETGMVHRMVDGIMQRVRIQMHTDGRNISGDSEVENSTADNQIDSDDDGSSSEEDEDQYRYE